MSKAAGSLRKVKDLQGHRPIARNESHGLLQIPLSKIQPNPDQPRKHFDKKTLQDLANSIAEHGVLQPIVVKRTSDSKEGDERYYIIAGERRYRASQLAGKRQIPAIMGKGRDEEQALIENIQREDLLPIEEAEAYAQLMERYTYKQQELADRVGKPRSAVSELLRLNTLPEKIKEECRTSDIPKNTLLELAKMGNSGEQLALWEAIKTGTYTVADARTAKKKSKSKKGIRKIPPTIQKIVKSGNELAKHLEKLQGDKLNIDADIKRQLESIVGRCQAVLRKL